MLERLRSTYRSSRNRRVLSRIEPELRQILTLREGLGAASDGEIGAAARELVASRGGRIRSSREAIQRAIALGCEGARRGLGLDVREEQLAAALLLDAGHVVEMRTGEGKTLAAALAVLPTALEGRGVHIVTTNTYLAGRDAEWMGPVYRRLGLEVGVVRSAATMREKRKAYLADVTYTSHSDVGFDHLRDHMRLRSIDWVQRGAPFAIIDEVDSILIDEARTPLVIGARGEPPSPLFARVTPLVEKLSAEIDVTVDSRRASATLSENGQEELSRRLRDGGLLDGNASLFDLENAELNQVVQRCLAARFCYRRDEHYVIDSEDRVVILDPFTGRLMPSRRWGDGQHQAVEAHERVEIRPDQPARASASYRSLFQRYERLAGMTGTATGLETEFREIYGLERVTLPTHRPVIRDDREDAVYLRETAKLEALVSDAMAAHRQGRPVLVGTASELSAVRVARALESAGAPARLLLARDHEAEASIIADAGRFGAVTVTTQLAGRGTDIRLGGGEAEEAARVIAVGGLEVLGFERHRARRIDEQLRGRAGRQGDPGSSRFYTSLEDSLVRRYRGAESQSLLEEAEAKAPPDWQERARRLVEDAQRSAENDDETLRVAARKLDGIVDRQRLHYYELRERLLLGRPERADDGDLPAMSGGKDRIRSLISALVSRRRTSASAGEPAGRPMARMLRREIYGLFGFAPKLEDFEGDPEAVVESLSQQAVSALAHQRRRLHAVVGRVMVDLVESAAPTPGERRRSDIERAFIEVAPMVELPDLEGDGLARALQRTVMDHLRGRMSREAPRRVVRAFRLLYVQAMDAAWADHLEHTTALRDGIHWRALGREDPVLIFEQEVHSAYLAMHRKGERQALKSLLASPRLTAESLRDLEKAIQTASLALWAVEGEVREAQSDGDDDEGA